MSRAKAVELPNGGYRQQLLLLPSGLSMSPEILSGVGKMDRASETTPTTTTLPGRESLLGQKGQPSRLCGRGAVQPGHRGWDQAPRGTPAWRGGPGGPHVPCWWPGGPAPGTWGAGGRRVPLVGVGGPGSDPEGAGARRPSPGGASGAAEPRGPACQAGPDLDERTGVGGRGGEGLTVLPGRPAPLRSRSC